jgi:hypothetical protein
MSEDTGLIERPRIPPKFLKFLKKLAIPFEKLKTSIKKIKNKNVQNGVYGGIFTALFVLFTSFSMYGTVIAFLVAFIMVTLISAIVKFIEKTKQYTISQRFGIALGFTLLLIFCAIVIMLIDTKIGNPIYTILFSLLTLDNSLYKNSAFEFFTSLGGSIQKAMDDFMELIQLNSEEKRALFMGSLIKYLGVFMAIVLICIALVKASIDPSALNRNMIPYGLLITIPLILSFILFSPLIKETDMPLLMMLGGGFIGFMILIYSYYTSSWTPSTVYYGGYLMNSLLFIIIAIGLAIIFKVFSGQLKKLSGWPGFFANLLFFIPCLMSDGLQYLANQFSITPNVVILLLFIEIIVILLYAYIPVIINKISQKNSALLLNHPVFMDKEIPIGNSSMFLMEPIDDNSVYKQANPYRTNYTFSMWIYLNPQSNANNAYINGAKIFDFGNGKPRISYKNQSDNTRLANKDIYAITFSNKGDATYEISLPNQKWNNFVFNYFDSKVDLYINGSLERTFEFSNNMPEYLPTDVITIGDKNGLQGAICNINYYKTPLSSEKIVTLYNLLSMKNPPLNV